MDPIKKEKRLKLLLNLAFMNGLFWIGFYLYAIYTLTKSLAEGPRAYCTYKIYTKNNIEIYDNYNHETIIGFCPDLEENDFQLKNGDLRHYMD